MGPGSAAVSYFAKLARTPSPGASIRYLLCYCHYYHYHEVFASSGEITAIMIKDDTKIEMKIKLPSSYPLKNVEVECNTKIGLTEFT